MLVLLTSDIWHLTSPYNLKDVAQVGILRSLMGRKEVTLMRLINFILPFVLLAAGCPNALEKQPRVETIQDVPADFGIALERTVCLGSCPAYRLTINAAGEGEFEGIKHTRAGVGRVPLTLSKSEVLELARAVEASGFFSLEDEYSFEKNCPRAVTDFPWAYISVRMGGREKSIKHYQGCGSGGEDLKALAGLERKIDDLTRSSRFLGE